MTNKTETLHTNLDDRIYAFTKRESFITIKDHKDNFENNTKCRLINPAKSELGKGSKKIVASIVTSLKEKTKLNLWKNTDSVLKWFKDLENKNKLSFMQFDICDFYANITEDILRGALEYAKQHTKVTSDEAKIIFQMKKAFIFKDGKPWIKKGNRLFDVTMGFWDGGEICE